VTDPAFRGHGLARRFYDEAWAKAAEQDVMLCCEVNEEPPNPGSMRFHERFGFKPVSGQQTEGGKKPSSCSHGCRNRVYLVAVAP